MSNVNSSRNSVCFSFFFFYNINNYHAHYEEIEENIKKLTGFLGKISEISFLYLFTGCLDLVVNAGQKKQRLPHTGKTCLDTTPETALILHTNLHRTTLTYNNYYNNSTNISPLLQDYFLSFLPFLNTSILMKEKGRKSYQIPKKMGTSTIIRPAYNKKHTKSTSIPPQNPNNIIQLIAIISSNRWCA